MKLDLSEIAANVGKHIHYDLKEECFEAEDVKCMEPIKGGIDFTNTGQLIVVRGSFSTKVELDCSRCLEKLTVPVNVKIEEQFPVRSIQTMMAGYQEEELEEEEEEPLFQNNIFDLSEYIRQAILVESPIRPLCDDACKGLCQTCGKNLNEGPCDCPIDIKSSPFSALADMLDDEKSNKT
jgi:uncharacterized protein